MTTFFSMIQPLLCKHLGRATMLLLPPAIPLPHYATYQIR